MTSSLPEPNFVSRDPNQVVDECLAQYQSDSGKTLYPAQPERLLVDVIAYRETLARVAIQQAAKQNLVNYATFPVLDYLAEFYGVTRFGAQSAITVLRFTRSSGAGVLAVPAGTRANSEFGAFFTSATATFLVGQTTLEINAVAEVPGPQANGLAIGAIAELITPINGVAVSNLTVTTGGTNQETDDQLRTRTKQAPEAFSNAGSTEAYRFFALNADPSIVDVAVRSPVSLGIVQLYPLTNTGAPPQAILDRVYAACNADRVRPITDLVQVFAPVQVDIPLVANVTLYRNYDAAAALAVIQAQAASYKAFLAAQLGRDIVPQQFLNALFSEAVYSIDLVSPGAIQILEPQQWANILTITITILGFQDG